MGEWVLDLWTPTQPDFVFTTGRYHGGTLGPGCHYLIGLLLVNPVSLIDGVRVDAWISVPLREGGGIAIRNGIGQVIDQVGMSTDSVFKERQPLPPLTGNQNRSYVRIGLDTGNNANDFHLVSPSSPQNSSMCSAPAQ
jgi:hypothetical protein